MSRYETIVCEHCGNKERPDSAINWIRLENAVYDTLSLGEMPFTGDYCSKKCVIGRLGGVVPVE